MNRYGYIGAMFVLAAALAGTGCMGSGDEVDCPDCDNVTQLLVGAKCVDIAEVEACGPDGHSHGTECHCFSGQEPVAIGTTSYCLQQGCAGGDEDTVEAEDLDMQACEHLGDTLEAVTAASSFDGFESAHLDIDTLGHVELPSGVDAYIHFPAASAGEYHVYAATAGVVSGFMYGDETAVVAENIGANSDCPSDFPEVWHIDVVNESGTTVPIVIHFAPGEAEHVELVILKGEDDED